MAGFQIHGLDRIYYHDRCSGLFQRGDDVFDVGGRGQIDRRRFQPQPAGADFDLIGRLFARNVVAFRPFGQVGDAGTDPLKNYSSMMLLLHSNPNLP